MKKYLISIFLLCSAVAHHSVYAYGEDGNPIHNLFGSLRRSDYSDKPTYHFSRVNKYEPVTEPIFYVERYDDTSKIIVGFNNMVVFGELKNDHHFVVSVNEDLNEDVNIPSYFLDTKDSGELFEVITLKPTIKTTTPFETTTPFKTTTTFPIFNPNKQSFTEYLMQLPVVSNN